MGLFDGVELGDLVLTGPRLALRPWAERDTGRLYELLQDRTVHEYIALPDPYTRADAERFVTDFGATGRVAGSALDCALTDASGDLVGSASLRLRERPEIGYWIAAGARGNGYAAEATRVLAEWGFAHRLPRVQLFCDVRNLASVRTALAAGFGYEGVSRGASISPVDDGAASRRADLARFARLGADPGDPIRPRLAALPREGVTDGVVRLRGIVSEDATGMLETDDELTLRWSFTPNPHTQAEAERAAAEAGLEWLVGGTGALAIVDVASGRFAGSVRLRLSGPPGVGGLGYVVHPDFRGRGYTSRALRLLTAWAFADGGFARLELGTKVDNLASQRAALTAGFTAEGVFARRLRNPDGTFGDEARFALINPALSVR